MTNRKNIGGPKTSEGRATVSKNAIKHGLSTMRPTDANEQSLVERFTQELIDFYKPSSPLESFQIERIAICRAKLAKLYEVENVRLQLAQQELLNDPKKIIQTLTGVSEVTKGMLLEKITHGVCALPLGLEPSVLEKIASEIFRFSGQIRDAQSFAISFPAFTHFLNSLIIADKSQEVALDHKLIQVCERIEKVFINGDKYYEYLLPLVRELSLFKRQRDEPKDSYSQGEKDELDEYIEWQEEERNAARAAHQKSPRKKPTPPAGPPSIFAQHDELMHKLRCFQKLLDCYRGLDGALDQFHLNQELRLKALTLSPQESDLFMRYQTTLERRLSGAIGELLELQKLKSYLPG